MALTLHCPIQSVASVDEFTDFVRSSVDLRDPESLCTAAPLLRALSNDRSLVVQQLNRNVIDAFRSNPLSSAQSILLGRGEHFYVRANVWPSTADLTGGRVYQDQFSYNLAHDHNFTFLTAGHLGPGYETEIFEYDHTKVEGYIGEPVEIRFLEKVRFAADMVMLYRASRDLHIQHPPEELTITLNLVVSLPEVSLRDQYTFDLERRTISGFPNELEASKRVSFIALAGQLGDANTRQLLEDLVRSHGCRRTRLAAYEALARLSGADAARIWAQAAGDPAPLVVRAARQHLEQLENPDGLRSARPVG